MAVTVHRVMYGAQSFDMRADWGQASCSIETRYADRWEQTQYQVANFGHRLEEAARCMVREAVEEGWGDEDMDEDMIDEEITDFLDDIEIVEIEDGP